MQFLDYEVEIGIAIRRPLTVGDRVTEASLAEHVAALAVANDVSARDLQLPKTQSFEAKSYPTFTPVGPELVLLGPRRDRPVRRPAPPPLGQRRAPAGRACRR